MMYLLLPAVSFLYFPLSLSCSSLLFLRVDNRPCSRLPSTCFPCASEAASFLRAVRSLKPTSFPALPELEAIITARGVQEEITSGGEETEKEVVKGRPTCPGTHTHSSEIHPNKTVKNTFSVYSV